MADRLPAKHQAQLRSPCHNPEVMTGTKTKSRTLSQVTRCPLKKIILKHPGMPSVLANSSTETCVWCSPLCVRIDRETSRTPWLLLEKVRPMLTLSCLSRRISYHVRLFQVQTHVLTVLLTWGDASRV